MTGLLRTIIMMMAALMLSTALLVRPAAAQQILRDAETEQLLRDASADIITAAGLRPEDVEIVLIGDDSINAFVAGGQIVYLHSGLITEADNLNQVQGVIAHEVGHITGGHIIRFADGQKQALGITIISLLLGAAAMAAGAGDAGMGIMAAGQRAAMGQFLAFTRAQEASADQAGAKFLGDAGISGKGSLEFFAKLQNQEYRLNIPQEDSYNRTHPLSRERIAALTDVYQASPYWNRPTDADLEARFQRVRAKLLAFVNPERALREFPHGDQSAQAHFARAYAYHRGVRPEASLNEVEALEKLLPDNPYVLEMKGQFLLENGRPEEAIPALRRAVQLAPDQPLIATTFGHALVASEERENYAEAKDLLKAAVTRDRKNPFAWFQLGVIYAAEGDEARASLASAERQQMLGQHQLAMVSAKRAMNGIEEGSADWIRAQDIFMTSGHEVKENEKNGKKERRR